MFNEIKKPKNNKKHGNKSIGINKKKEIKKTKKKILKKKIPKKQIENSLKSSEEQTNSLQISEETKEEKEIDISLAFSNLKEMENPYVKFEEGKNVIQYLFEDTKDVSDKEMFHFLLLTNHFFNKHLNN
jgi:seryl-tRNA synthetase